MAKRMLIDATHPEETRVVVVNGTRLEQLDVETSTKKQIKGTIYLAKIIRVEPSLQAAFVDYGGNRHGFLAFSEIHPDYFQIPDADRQALLASQARASVADEFSDDADEIENPAAEAVDDGENDGDAPSEADNNGRVPRQRSRSFRDYKIQEVIKRRQIILVQVIKEERGNKGAALTTYLSLAGRYCVLMPNTARGGGVSRKIVNVADRRRLKQIMGDLDVPSSMAVILRTAGQERSKAEIKRDYDYLLRTWSQIRDTTFASRAPALIYEEANLIKRAIRDIYSADVEEVLVDGDEGYRLARDFMALMAPPHARKVMRYADEGMPLFQRYQVDSQLDAMHSPSVYLRSGGYIVINQTEALVAIDVNSGRATKERHIEETALKTNLEAAEEIARQLRLRDLAGLIVIDFIDMEEGRNNSAVERRLKEALKLDRARIQIGRISPFGLLELSRQRLRPSLMETSFEPCPHCRGTGMVRSVESAAVHILRVIEEEGVRRRSSEVTVSVATPVALYILNNKRKALAEIEARYDFMVFLRGDDTLIVPDHRMERVKVERDDGEEVSEEDVRPEPVARETSGRWGRRDRPERSERDRSAERGDRDRQDRGERGHRRAVTVDVPAFVAEDVAEVLEEDEEAPLVVAEAVPSLAVVAEESDSESRKRRKRRKRRRRGGDETDAVGAMAQDDGDTDGEVDAGEEPEADLGEDQPEAMDLESATADDESDGGSASVGEGEEEGRDDGRRRRSRRGGRRRRRGERGDGERTDAEGMLVEEVAGEEPALVASEAGVELPEPSFAEGVPEMVPDVEGAEAPVPPVVAAVEPLVSPVVVEEAAVAESVGSDVAVPEVKPVTVEGAPAPERKVRRGWWSRSA